MNFYNWYEKLKDMDIKRPNDINGDWSLKPIEDISIARREEPEEQEISIQDMEKKESTRLGGNQWRHAEEFDFEFKPIQTNQNICAKCGNIISEQQIAHQYCGYCGHSWQNEKNNGQF